MVKLHVGGFFHNNGYKTLDDAISNAYSNDAIILHKNCTLAGSVINKNLTIIGNGNTIKCPNNMAAIRLDLNAHLSLYDVIFEVPMQSNALVADNDFCGFIELHNVTTYHTGKSARKQLSNVDDYYPSVILLSGNHLLIDNCMLDSLACSDFEQCSIKDSQIKMLDSSQLIVKRFNAIDSIFYNATMQFGEIATFERVHIVRGSYFELFSDEGFIEFDNCQFESDSDSFKTHKDQVLFMQNEVLDAFYNGHFILKRCSFVNDLNFVGSEVQLRNLELNNSTINCTKTRCQLLDVVDNAENWFLSDSKKVDNKYTGDDANEIQALDELDKLIGLRNVKSQIHKFVDNLRLNRLRQERGMDIGDNKVTLHMVFAGNAGTGKTTVARLVGAALSEVGILSEDKFIEASAKDLVSGYVGQTMTKTHELIESALGGVLFIDEAYALAPDNNGSSFNDEAVTQLIADAENYRDKLVIILAGYSDDMKHFFNEGNSGLKSRFTNWIEFEDYTLSEMCQIAKYQLFKAKVVCDNNLLAAIRYSLDKLMQLHGADGGNGRLVRNFIDAIILERDSRLAKLNISQLSNDSLNRIIRDDVKLAYIKCRQNSIELSSCND